MFGSGCALTGMVIILGHFGALPLIPLAALAVSLFVIVAVKPRLFAPIQRAMDAGTNALLKLLTWLLLLGVFICIFIPGRLISSIYKSIHRQKSPNAAKESYWQPIAPATDSSRRFTSQF